jgi:uncharacterized membrane protein
MRAPPSQESDAKEAAAPVPETRGQEEDAALFDAILQAHRSLSPLGFVVLMAFVCLVSFTAGIAFLIAGAWPVFGFFGLDVLLIYIAFRLSYRSGRLYETVRLTRDSLTVQRVFPSGEVKSWTFQPYWLRVEMDDPPRPDSRLRLTTHGRSLVIGSFLTPTERLEVAEALKAALATQRARPQS